MNQKQNSLMELAKNLGVVILNIEEFSNKSSFLRCKCKNGHDVCGTVEFLLKTNFECLECISEEELDIKDETPYFLSLDAATYVTGVSIFNRSGQMLSHQVISINKKKDYFDRAEEIIYTIKDIITSNDIKCVVLEDIQYQQNPVLFKKLAMLQGLIRFLVIKTLNIELITAMADEWRSYNHVFGSKRPEQKAASISRAKDIYKKDISEDESESIFLGKYGIYLFNNNRKGEEV